MQDQVPESAVSQPGIYPAWILSWKLLVFSEFIVKQTCLALIYLILSYEENTFCLWVLLFWVFCFVFFPLLSTAWNILVLLAFLKPMFFCRQFLHPFVFLNNESEYQKSNCFCFIKLQLSLKLKMLTCNNKSWMLLVQALCCEILFMYQGCHSSLSSLTAGHYSSNHFSIFCI